MPISILALDLALTTGVARCIGDEITTCTWDLRLECDPTPATNRSIGPAIRLTANIDVEHNKQTLSRVVFENALTMHSRSAWIQNSMQSAVMLWCYRHGVPFARYTPSVWKRALIGNGKGQVKKDEYHRLAREEWPNLDLQTDDESAARWLLEAGLLEIPTNFGDPQND